jgi:hypothetical protein
VLPGRNLLFPSGVEAFAGRQNINHPAYLSRQESTFPTRGTTLSQKRITPPAGLFLSKTWRPLPSDHRQDFPVRLPVSRESLAIQPVSGEMGLRPPPPGTGRQFCCGRRPCRPVHNHGSGGLPTLAVPRNGYFRLVKRGARGIRPSRH